MDVADEARRAIEPQRFPAAQRHAQERVESNEMIHVGVGDKNIICAQQPGGAERFVMAEIEQQRAFGPADLDIHAGVAEDVVDEI